MCCVNLNILARCQVPTTSYSTEINLTTEIFWVCLFPQKIFFFSLNPNPNPTHLPIRQTLRPVHCKSTFVLPHRGCLKSHHNYCRSRNDSICREQKHQQVILSNNCTRERGDLSFGTSNCCSWIYSTQLFDVTH